MSKKLTPSNSPALTSESPVIDYTGMPYVWVVSPISPDPIPQVDYTAEIAFYKSAWQLADSPKIDNDAFKGLVQKWGLYKTSANLEEIERVGTEIAKVKTALKTAGFNEDSDIVKSAIKGLVATLDKAQKEQKDNLPELAVEFKVKLAKAGKVIAHTGELSTHRPDLNELKTTDYLLNQQDKKMVLVHSMTVAQTDLDKLGIKADSQKWVGFEFNGLLQFNRNSDGKGRMIASDVKYPESWVKVHEIVCTSEKLSGLVGVGIAKLGLQYNGNGWQSNSQLANKFDKVTRVIKEG